MTYKIIKSKRKTLTMTVERDGTVVIKAPLRATKKDIDNFYNKNINWVESRKREHLQNAAKGTPPTRDEINRLKKQAKDYLTQRTEYFANLMDLDFKDVKITSAKTRWGSCKKDGSICYSYRTMLLEEDCRDYIVVHELCHLLHFNHSKDFWQAVELVLPDYRQRQRKIKEFSHYDLY